MKKSAYMLLTIVAALAALFFLGYWMSYVMNVVREHGGYVTVESVEGKFSEFTLSLPLPDEGPEADAREG